MSNTNPSASSSATPPASDFIRDLVQQDVQTNKHQGQVITRFPPEPNGYLHIGHAKAICVDFGIAQEFGGRCHLRMDDTNPEKEDLEYINAIKQDIHWLGFDWSNHFFHASDYFDQLYEWALALIKAGHAYVCDLTSDEVTLYRGTLTTPGKDSPFRNRPAAESLDLFERMRKGEFPDGTRTLRAKIDMAHPNITLRDPVMYRIVHASHPHTGDKWCIYPSYDWTHGQSDWLEGITHSICTLEFEIHKPLYDWFIETLTSIGCTPRGISYRPHQYEFARLNLTYTLTSKRKLLQLVKEGHVSGWDDPRMSTIRAFRRRGYTPESIRNFVREVGVTKFESVIDFGRLENTLRDDLNKRALRRMAVLKPLKVIIDNYPDGQVDELDAINNPEDPAAGTRKVPFSKVLYIEQDDFMETPPPKYFRLSPGVEVRLRYAYFIKCVGVDKDAAGKITAVHCTYDPATRGGDSPDKRKVKATIHWVSAQHAHTAEVRLYDRLFNSSNPSAVPEGKTFLDNINPQSLVTLGDAQLEPSLKDAVADEKFQFERLGYFVCDTVDSTPGKPVFNRAVTLKDTWAKEQKKA
jgi:glutaminyl-tRNA synthetase